MYDKVLNERMQKVLTEKMVPFDVDNSWYSAATFAMRFASPISLGIIGPEMKEIYDKAANRQPLNCYEFAVLNTTLEKLTLNQWRDTDERYFKALELCAVYAKDWNQIIEEVQKKEMEKLMKEKTKKTPVVNMGQA